MKKLLIAAAASALIASSAYGADMVEEDVVPPAPTVIENPFDGFYIGLHGGYGDGDRSGEGWWDIGGFIGDDFDFNFDQGGKLLGGQLGYNWVNGGFLLGAELSVSAADINGELNFDDGFGGGISQTNMDFIGQVKGKIGFANDQFAIYGTGGIVVAHSTVDIASLSLGVHEFDDMHSGYSVGAGLDMMITENASIGVSYDHITLHSERGISQSTSIIAFAPTAFAREVEPSVQLFKVFLNYHF
ncbi:MAG: outer membrane beta-barrel protein [Planctomycetaceae bacterium]|nr:outer membrane beta-barrel protein [Planctomycetaceae bacterium]